MADQQGKQRKPTFIERTVNGWFNRLLGAASEGSFGAQEEQYAANRTSRDYIWNTVGITAWGM
ncbi:MAG: lipopolysaccharide biosynthesis protein, partial [Raoultibacter sp.]